MLRSRVSMVGSVVFVLSLTGAALAQTTVAFVSLEPDDSARPVIDELRAAGARTGYRAMPPSALREALEQAIGDARAAAIERGQAALGQADQAIAKFHYRTAITTLERARQRAAMIEPDDEIVALLADLSFSLGLVRAYSGDMTGAKVEFAATRRLNPDQVVDPKLHPPKVVAAYEAAAKPPPRIEVELATDPSDAVVWVDGRKLGTAPQREQLATGVHVVSASGPGLVPTGEVVTIGQDTAKVELSLSPALAERSIKTTRTRMVSTGETRELTAGAERLAKLTLVDVVVLVRKRADGWEAARYRDGKLSAWLPAPSRALETAMAADASETTEPVEPIVVANDTPSTSRRMWWGIGIGAGAVAAGVVAYILLTPDQTYELGGFCPTGGC